MSKKPSLLRHLEHVTKVWFLALTGTFIILILKIYNRFFIPKTNPASPPLPLSFFNFTSILRFLRYVFSTLPQYQSQFRKQKNADPQRYRKSFQIFYSLENHFLLNFTSITHDDYVRSC